MIDVKGTIQRHHPDVARVLFSDDQRLGCAVVMQFVGDELAELLVETFHQLAFQEVEITPWTATAALVSRAVGTGNYVEVIPPPPGQHLGMQLRLLWIPEAAIGGVGTVIVNTKTFEVTTYGGRAFPAIRPVNVYESSVFTMAELEMIPLSGVERGEEPSVTPKTRKKKAARRKVEATKKAARRKQAAKKEGGDEAEGEVVRA